jgi:hypothetical protein
MNQTKTVSIKYNDNDLYFELSKHLIDLYIEKKIINEKLKEVNENYKKNDKSLIEHYDVMIKSKKEEIVKLRQELETTRKNNKTNIIGLITIADDTINKHEDDKKRLNRRYITTKQQLKTTKKQIKLEEIETWKKLAQLKEVNSTPIPYPPVKSEYVEQIPIQRNSSEGRIIRTTRRKPSGTSPIFGGAVKRYNRTIKTHRKYKT